MSGSQGQAAGDIRRGPLDIDDPRYKTLKDTQINGYSQPVLDKYQRLVEPHVESFNYFLNEGLTRICENPEEIEVEDRITGQKLRFWWSNIRVGRPMQDGSMNAQRRLYPRDCREAGTTYKAPMSATFNWAVDSGSVGFIEKKLGGIPIMVRSSACWLHGLNREELVACREEANEMGGYFICNGIERIVRCLIMPRRHYIMAVRRGAFQKRGANYTDAATLIRCVRHDQSSGSVRCHYLRDGLVNFAFTMQRAEYFIPAGVLLKCFLEVSDRELYSKLIAGAAPGSGAAAFFAERAELLLRHADQQDLRTKTQCIEYLGRHFRVALPHMRDAPDYEIGEELLREHIFIHLDSSHPADKLELLVAMLHKLYALVCGATVVDNPDALTHHEILLPGDLLTKFTKEKLQDTLGIIRMLIMKDLQTKPEKVKFEDDKYIIKLIEKLPPTMGKKYETLLNTGNLISRSGLDLGQATGFTVVAEKLNFFRYLSHFRSVHRGAYFAEMRTTTVRKLLPESWGFMCPVHTPDGAPCGLLNHFSVECRVVTQSNDDDSNRSGQAGMSILALLADLGLIPTTPAIIPPPPPEYVVVMLDGRVLGHVRAGETVSAMVARLREIKALALEAIERNVEPESLGLTATEEEVPYHMEIVYIPPLAGGPYPGVFLFTNPARMIRPVLQLHSGRREVLGTLEQCFLAVQCPDGGHGGSPGLAYTHREISANAMLSVVASLTPYSDYNQSPRNMYQCQMAKQTMGTPGHALPHRTDTKMYRLQTPQAPICRTIRYAEYKMDEFPNGTNAIVAVLAYTGYDMEDAMILNKSSMERGLAHGSIYKTETIDLRDDRGAKKVFAAEPHDAKSRAAQSHYTRPRGAFGQRYPQNVPAAATSPAVGRRKSKTETRPVLVAQPNNKDSDRIEADGLPAVGAVIWPGQTFCCTRNEQTGKHNQNKLKGEEVAVVDQVTLIGLGGSYSQTKGNRTAKDMPTEMPQRVNIRLLFNRNPLVGDKFASRHGQKGVLSILWPDVDMPYCSSSGIRPDLIINPHAFPSRMTIGMLVESLVSKGAALAGQFVDASPFQRADGIEKGNAVERWGEYLERQGFSKYGQETMISGITGQEMPCDIFVGPVYYQRLRHMVSDKFQVRSTGPVNNLTRQPVKGRKFGGGIRFGEMERDSLLAHGAAYLLHDRLHACSDYHVADVCTKCGSMLAPLSRPLANANVTAGLQMAGGSEAGGKTVCPQCSPNSSVTIERVALPYVFRYLATELAAMNIKVELGIK